MSEKLDMASVDYVSQNIEQIAALFPNCVTETAKGKKIDFDLLKQELNGDTIEGTKERYRLEWPGKKEAIVTANLPTTKTLRPVREDSVDFDNTENLYIVSVFRQKSALKFDWQYSPCFKRHSV